VNVAGFGYSGPRRMILTLTASCLRSQIKTGSRGSGMSLSDLPQFTRDTLGLRGLTLSTDLLVGADRRMLDGIRERADKAGCACLLLVEPGTVSLDGTPAKVEALIERMKNVVQAAQLLGCNSSAFSIKNIENDDQRKLVADRLRKVVERAEKLDVNVLVSPAAGIEPETISDLLKRVGGFRIGTYPDFEVASKAADPLTYLRRLSPYASAVCATTFEFADPDSAKHEAKPKAKPPAKPRALSPEERLLASIARAAAGDEEDDDAPPPSLPGAKAQAKPVEAPQAKGKGTKSSKAAASPPPPPPSPAFKTSDEDDDASLDAELDALDPEALLAELAAEEEAEMEPLATHVGYDIIKMVEAVASVGYDGALAVDYRGKGDVTQGVQTSARVLLAAVEAALAAG